MIRVIIIDDERDALEVLEWQIRNFCPKLEILALCQGADEGISRIRDLRPDLIFLDIEMPGKNGFDLLNSFEEPVFDVIFTTAYDQFAIKAFKFAAFDYLLKPIDGPDLQMAVERYLNRKNGSIRDQLKMLMSQYQRPPATGRIALPSGEGMMMVRPEQIIRCQSSSNYTRIYLSDGQHIVASKTLKEVEDILGGFDFYRIHHSHLINLSHVQRFIKTDGGYVLMSDGEHITVARNRKDGFIEQFSKI